MKRSTAATSLSTKRKKNVTVKDEIINKIYNSENVPLGDFIVGSILSEIDLPSNPKIKIMNYGILPLPVNKTLFDDVKKHSRPSPYGLGERTILNPQVRNSLQLEPEKFKITNKKFEEGVDKLVNTRVKPALGLNESTIYAKLYKLLVYEKGGKFDPHRDTEKEDNMFGTLIVQLPSIFTGGDLIVKHHNRKITFNNSQPGSDEQCVYVAHYSSCVHQLKTITSGYRVALVYSLCWDGNGSEPMPYTPTEHSLQISKLLKEFLQKSESPFFCWALEYEYSNFSIDYGSVSSLKGSDIIFVSSLLNVAKPVRQQYDIVIATANKTFSEYGECDKGEYTYSRWGKQSWGSGCGSKRCGGNEWEVEDDTLTFELTDFRSLSDPSVIYDEDFRYDLDPENDIVNFMEFEEDEFWSGDQGEGCSGPSGNEGATRERWYMKKVIIVSKKNSDFSRACSESIVSSNNISNVRTLPTQPINWEQPEACVPNHPEVTEFLRGPDKTLRYVNFNDIRHAKNWATKHENDRGCFMEINVGQDANGTAYADITKTRSKC